MSLLCDETGTDIVYGTELYMSTRNNSADGMFTALSSEVVSVIPIEERRASPCNYAEGDGGLDIHSGSAGRNSTGSYAWSSMEIGDFLFSISSETALKFLPHNYAHHYRGEQLPRKTELVMTDEFVNEIMKDDKTVNILNELFQDPNISVRVLKNQSS